MSTKKNELSQGELFSVPEAEAPSRPAPPAKARTKAPAKPVARRPVQRRGRKPKPRQLKMVRESLTLPPQEQKVLNNLQLLLFKRGQYEVTRSLILRAGIARLAQLPPAELVRAVKAVAKGAGSKG